MLKLTRKVGETVKVGDDVFVTVTKIRGGQVMLGFTAPREVNIARTEIIGREEKPKVTNQVT